MTIISTYLLLIILILFAITCFISFMINKIIKIFLIELTAIAIVFIILKITINFPYSKQAFGGTSQLMAIAIMFVCSLIGISARYFYNRKEEFNWSSFLKPFLISPIVLLPLLSSLQRMPILEPIELISFSILAFQNGFFWRVVYENSRKSLSRN